MIDYLLFQKSVAKIAAYRKHGCGSHLSQTTLYSTQERDQKDLEREAEENGRRGYRYINNRCEGRLLLSYDYDSQPFVQ